MWFNNFAYSTGSYLASLNCPKNKNKNNIKKTLIPYQVGFLLDTKPYN